MKITQSEWESELQRLQASTGEGHTTRELTAIWRCSAQTVLERLHRLKNEGRLTVTSRTVQSIIGRPIPVVAYKLKPDAVSPPAPDTGLAADSPNGGSR